MKKWMIMGILAAVIVLLVGVNAYTIFDDRWSPPPAVLSMEALPGAVSVNSASWSPDGSTILYASWPEDSDQSIYRIDADGGNRVCLAQGRLPAWSPDGSKIVFASSSALELMNADGSERSKLLDLEEALVGATNLQVLSISWSPDGSTISFEVVGSIQNSAQEQPGEVISGIWFVSADGGGLRRVVVGRDLAWSPDGQSIAFISVSDNSQEAVYTSRIDGSDLRKLVDACPFISDICLSPDGSRLAFVTLICPDEEEGTGVSVVDANGSNRTLLAEGSMCDATPEWSPDGKMLAFESVSGSGDIWMANADGTGNTMIAKASSTSRPGWFACKRTSIEYRNPRWSPDGTSLLFLNRLTEERRSGTGTYAECHGCDRLWVLQLDLENGPG